jgi:hypothetical protein
VTVAAEQGVERRQSVAIVVFGVWMVTGLFLDGWSHNQNKPETFFTPWHGVLYSGFGAAVLWFAWDGRRTRDDAGPPGGRLTAIGMAVFVVGAVGDFGWHEAFGVEASIDALLSPTHLLLMTGGVLMVTGPFRVAWNGPSPRRAPWPDVWPALGSITLATAVVCFFLMYLSPFRPSQVEQPNLAGFRYLTEQTEIHAIAAVLVTSTVLMAALLLVLRRWQPPFGACTLLLGGVALATCGLDTFDRWPLALCGVGGGVVADVLVARTRSVRLIAGLTPVALWLPYFIVFKTAYDLPWTIHMWLGTVALAALGGLCLSVLSDPPALPTRA